MNVLELADIYKNLMLEDEIKYGRKLTQAEKDTYKISFAQLYAEMKQLANDRSLIKA